MCAVVALWPYGVLEVIVFFLVPIGVCVNMGGWNSGVFISGVGLVITAIFLCLVGVLLFNRRVLGVASSHFCFQALVVSYSYRRGSFC